MISNQVLDFSRRISSLKLLLCVIFIPRSISLGKLITSRLVMLFTRRVLPCVHFYTL